jgi:hypothetical protein
MSVKRSNECRGGESVGRVVSRAIEPYEGKVCSSFHVTTDHVVP